MGRPKKGTKPERANADEFVRIQILSLRGSKEYDDFVTAAYEKTRIPKSEMFREAFREWSEKKGLGTPPTI